MPFSFSSRSPRDSSGDDGANNNAASDAAADHSNENLKTKKDNSIGSRIRTFLLLHVLTALLPPMESKEELKQTEYYQVLGLKNQNKNASAEQIRKAYKQKSLELHPDKIAQRQQQQQRRRRNNNNTNANGEENTTIPDVLEPQAAAELFLKVQEAHAALSDAHNRQVYHQFGCSPARYKFVHDTEGEGAAVAIHNPTMVYENLTQATCVNKTRLVSLFTLFILLALLQPILICAKLNQELASSGGPLKNTPWSVILIPFWIVYGILFMALQLLLVCCWIRDSWQVRWFALQHFLLLIGIALLVQVWDGHRGDGGSVNWHALSTPFYLAIICRVAGMAQSARDLLDVVHSKMASLDHLQQTEPRPVRPRRGRQGGDCNNNNNNDANNTSSEDDDDDDDFLSEEEWITQLSEKYVIVTPDPQLVEAHIMLWHEEHDAENNNENNEEEPAAAAASSRAEIPEEEMESIRIASSGEYQAALEQVQQLQRSAGNFFVYGILMVALIAAKLTPTQLATKASWWAIFTPLWIYLFFQMMQALAWCCCSFLAAGNNDHVIILASAAAASAEAAATTTSGNAPSSNDVENPQQPSGATAAAASTATAGTTTTSSPKNKNSNDRRPQQRSETSVNWANAEGSMDLPSITSTTRSAAAATTTMPNDNDDDNASLTPSDEGCFGQKGSADPPGITADEIAQRRNLQDPPVVPGSSIDAVPGSTPPSHGEQQQQQQQQPGTVGRSDDTADGDDDDESSPHHKFDEETFRRWQRAQTAADASAMEAQAKGQWQCCVAIFQLIILCLVVGKLQDDYHPEQPEPSGQTGYNAFWILFPFFVLAGILVCCCSCLIYTAGSSGLDDLVKAQTDKKNGDDAEGNANQTGNSNTNNMPTDASSGSSPTIPLAAPPTTTMQAPTTTTTTQGEIPGQPVASDHQPTAASTAAAVPTAQPPTAAVAGTVGGGGDIENGGMDDLD